MGLEETNTKRKETVECCPALIKIDPRLKSWYMKVNDTTIAERKTQDHNRQLKEAQSFLFGSEIHHQYGSPAGRGKYAIHEGVDEARFQQVRASAGEPGGRDYQVSEG